MSRRDVLQLLADQPLKGAPTIAKAKLARPKGDARGYYRLPGSGPEGETCKSCAHSYPTGCDRRYWKCQRVAASHSPKTDIRLSWAACSGWERSGKSPA